MYWTYLGEVFKRAFAPTVRITDGLQIAAASALPAFGKFVGVKMPADIGNDALSYIGAATVAFLVIRLFWSPYSLWKEDKLAVSELKLELSKPERLVAEHLAKHRANAMIKLCALIQQMAIAGMSDDAEYRKSESVDAFIAAKKHAMAANMPSEFLSYLTAFSFLCGENISDDRRLIECEEALISAVHGVIPIATLQRLLRSDTVSETQP